MTLRRGLQFKKHSLPILLTFSGITSEESDEQFSKQYLEREESNKEITTEDKY
jgi:hypothetical protein